MVPYTFFLLFYCPSQDCFGDFESFMVPYTFFFYSSSVKNVMGDLIGITLNLKIAFGGIAILAIFLIQEHGISLNSLNYLQSFINILQFSAYRLFTFLATLIPKIFGCSFKWNFFFTFSF